VLLVICLRDLATYLPNEECELQHNVERKGVAETKQNQRRMTIREQYDTASENDFYILCELNFTKDSGSPILYD
jgi:hypothetical protein